MNGVVSMHLRMPTISMDDDGDYFTWTLRKRKPCLAKKNCKQRVCITTSTRSVRCTTIRRRTFCTSRASVEEIAARHEAFAGPVRELLASAKKKMYAARLERPTPYVDKTVYVGWNSLCVSAYLEAAKILGLDDARHFGLRSLDRILSEAWRPGKGLLHVIAYSDPKAVRREVRGLLDDYAFTAIACLDAYETTADLSYFKFARSITDSMIEKFFDPVSGGFFDTEISDGSPALGVLGARRKPFQDSPTPAGNSMAAIALSRMHGYTNDETYRDKAEQTMEVFAGTAEQFGIFGATYGIAAVHFSQPHTQVVVLGTGRAADQMWKAAAAKFAFNKTTIKLTPNEAIAPNLPPALAATIPAVPGIQDTNVMAVVCSGFSCQPPVSEPEELAQMLQNAMKKPAA